MMDLDLPIACSSLDAKEKEGNKKRTTDHTNLIIERPHKPPPCTDAT